MDNKERSTDESEVELSEEEEVNDQKQQKRNQEQNMEGKQDDVSAILPSIKRRINALKNLQLQVVNLDAAFYLEVHALEMKYMRLYYPYMEKRAEIINGRYEPSDAECQWESESEEQEIIDGVEKTKINDSAIEKKKDDAKGIPGFWLTIFKNVNLLSEMVQEHDEPILEHLEDIKVIMLEKDPMGFVLEFHFGANDYFTNSVLTKEYNMKCQPDSEHPFDFEGPEIYKCTGCSIMWCKDKNVTVKTVRKRQKHKSRGSVRTVVKAVPTDSFFNFFIPPELPKDPSVGVAESVKDLLASDFEIGHYIRERVVPSAILLYTGEGLDDEEEYEEEEEEEEEESSSEEESSDENDKGDKTCKDKKKLGQSGRRGHRHPSTNDESNDDEGKESRTISSGRRGGVRGAVATKGVKVLADPSQQNPVECKTQ